MRVTKIIREYIEKEVAKRIALKYHAEEAKVKENTALRDEFLDGLTNATKEAYTKYFEEHFHKISHICEDVRNSPYGNRLPNFYAPNVIKLHDYHCIDSVYQWRTRFQKEVDDKVNAIIVALELGGSKSELEEMLARIEKEAKENA